MPWAEQGDVCAVLLVGLKPSPGTGDGERVCVIPWEKFSRPPGGVTPALSPRVPTWVEQPQGAVPRAACGDSNLHINKYLIWF